MYTVDFSLTTSIAKSTDSVDVAAVVVVRPAARDLGPLRRQTNLGGS